VLGPTIDELVERAVHLDPTTQLFVFVPKSDSSLPDPRDAALRDGRPSHVTTGILQEMPLVLEKLNLDAPPASLQMTQQVPHLAGGQLRPDLPG
jgi:hypothetical protein